MRTLLIVLSISLFFTLIQYSNGAPRRPVSLESEEDDSVETNDATDLKPIIDSSDQSAESDEVKPKSKPMAIQISESDQSSEERKIVAKAIGRTLKSGEPNSHSNEQDANDDNNED